MNPTDVIQAIIAVGQEIGKDLMPLFQKQLPALNTSPLPDAETEMLGARTAALQSVSGVDGKQISRVPLTK